MLRTKEPKASSANGKWLSQFTIALAAAFSPLFAPLELGFTTIISGAPHAGEQRSMKGVATDGMENLRISRGGCVTNP